MEIKEDLPISLNIVESSEPSWRNSLASVRGENKTTTVSLGYTQQSQLVTYKQVEAEVCVHWPVHLPLMHLPMFNKYSMNLKIYKTRASVVSIHFNNP